MLYVRTHVPARYAAKHKQQLSAQGFPSPSYLTAASFCSGDLSAHRSTAFIMSLSIFPVSSFSGTCASPMWDLSAAADELPPGRCSEQEHSTRQGGQQHTAKGWSFERWRSDHNTQHLDRRQSTTKGWSFVHMIVDDK